MPEAEIKIETKFVIVLFLKYFKIVLKTSLTLLFFDFDRNHEGTVTVKNDDSVKVLSGGSADPNWLQAGWIKVMTVNGNIGYIPSNYTAPETVTQSF